MPFNASLGITQDSKAAELAEAWQILSPVRNHDYGTSEINRKIQSKYRRGILVRSRHQGPRPFGEQEIVWSDKVIQALNRTLKAWPQGKSLDYVANGEIGLVVSTNKNLDCLYVEYAAQPE